MSRTTKTGWIGALLLALSLQLLPVYGQKAPPSPDKAWTISVDSTLQSEIAQARVHREILDPNQSYSLADLIDIAERNNPETRGAWERAKQKSANLGVARGALYPTVIAMASASTNQYSLFFEKFYHENVDLFPATLNLSYTLLDFGGRSANIDLAKANLLKSDFSFNDTHRRIIFQVMQAYYHLLDAIGQEEAAQATLADAQTVQQSAEERLANGLATLPDVLESRAATAQARYELVSIQNLAQSARGVLATILGASPTAPFQVQGISRIAAPQVIEEPVQSVIERALMQRPDLLAQAETLQAADAEVKQARSAYYPVISVSADWGHSNGIGAQDFGPTVSSSIYPYQAKLQLTWDIFDGGIRRREAALAQANRQEAQSQLASLRDQIENEVWNAYFNVKTAQQQAESAEALFQAADQSYSAAKEAYGLGVRTLLDVTAAQRDLARARTARVTARTELLTDLADFASRVGDLVQTVPAPVPH